MMGARSLPRRASRGGRQDGEDFQARHPGLKVAGSHHGYWTDDREIIRIIRQAKPDYLFMGIPSPRKEFWLAANLKQLSVPFAMGVGGSFDVMAGIYRRAPRWACDHGLEWLWRLVQEPRRMWRRYLIGNSQFAALVVRECCAARA